MTITKASGNVVEVLEAARNLISDPERWTIEVCARDKDYQACGSKNPNATKWCAIGAIVRYAADPIFKLNARKLLEDIVGNIGNYNDSHTHAEVIAVFDAAITAAKRRNLS